MLKCENLPSTNFTISGAQYNFSKTSTPLPLATLGEDPLHNDELLENKCPNYIQF